MSYSYQAYVILANGHQINSDRHVISDTAANHPKWIEAMSLMTKMLNNFQKLATVTLQIDGESRVFQTKFLVTAGMNTSNTDDEPTVSDEELLDGISFDNVEVLHRILDS